MAYHREPTQPTEHASTFDFERNWRAYAETANERFLAALKEYFRKGGKA